MSYNSHRHSSYVFSLFFFSFCSSDYVISSILFFRSPICSSAWSVLLLKLLNSSVQYLHFSTLRFTGFSFFGGSCYCLVSFSFFNAFFKKKFYSVICVFLIYFLKRVILNSLTVY